MPTALIAFSTLEWLVQPFQSGFAMRALTAGSLVAVVCATVGVWVVLRSLSFIGDALAHGVIPGIAVASLMGWDLTIGAAIAAVITVIGITYVTEETGLPEDTSTGLLFAGMLSLGVMIISRSSSFAVDVTAFLFGDILGVTSRDIRTLSVAAVIAIVVSVLGYRGFVAMSFDERKAEVLGLRPGLMRFVLLGLITMAVVTSFRAVGSLLVFGLLVAPAATATLIARRVWLIMGISLVIGVASVVIGMELSYHYDLAGSAAMSGTAVAIFFLTLLGRRIVDRFTKTADATTTV